MFVDVVVILFLSIFALFISLSRLFWTLVLEKALFFFGGCVHVAVTLIGNNGLKRRAAKCRFVNNLCFQKCQE